MDFQSTKFEVITCISEVCTEYNNEAWLGFFSSFFFFGPANIAAISRLYNYRYGVPSSTPIWQHNPTYQ